MTYKCQWCNALKWKDETPGMCCSAGKVQLEPFKQLPEPDCKVYSLVKRLHPNHVHFLDNIRKYNACFQMTSFGGKQIKEGGFSPTIKIQEQVYHLIGSILPEPGQDARFLQIYFVGEDDREANIRCSKFPDLRPNLIKQLQLMLHEVNPYIKGLKTAIDKISPSESFKFVIHADKKPQREHKGRFNAPTANEVAVVLVDQHFDRRDIILESRSNSLQRISEIHRAYDTLQYPLICPCKKTVSAVSFYSYRIMIREGEDNFLVKYRALFKTERLNYIKNNQAKLRADNYIHLKDAIGRQDTEANQLGQMVVLPSSFTGGWIYARKNARRHDLC
ncbi:hypothetical protein ABMA27_016944 [Loxostege sticticalis]|uniref:Helitron helicase-like domain-containing protein n=1 Tax=Loxostege sticticalis TaxID=481309 RepID=A0ABR3GYM4_LOXSC